MSDDLAYIAKALAEFFKDEPEKIIYWLTTPNAELGGIAPAWLMLNDRSHKVAQFVKDAMEENKP
jgi:hypothetical protein